MLVVFQLDVLHIVTYDFFMATLAIPPQVCECQCKAPRATVYFDFTVRIPQNLRDDEVEIRSLCASCGGALAVDCEFALSA